MPPGRKGGQHGGNSLGAIKAPGTQGVASGGGGSRSAGEGQVSVIGRARCGGATPHEPQKQERCAYRQTPCLTPTNTAVLNYTLQY